MRLHIVYKCVYDLLQQVTEVSEVRKYHAQVFWEAASHAALCILVKLQQIIG